MRQSCYVDGLMAPKSALELLADAASLIHCHGAQVFKWNAARNTTPTSYSGSKELAHRAKQDSKQTSYVHFAVPPAISSPNPSVLDFTLQGRELHGWCVRPVTCPGCVRCNASTGNLKIEAKGWECRILLDVDQIKVLAFRRYLCFHCQAARSKSLYSSAPFPPTPLFLFHL